jgi:hypothetical protein
MNIETDMDKAADDLRDANYMKGYDHGREVVVDLIRQLFNSQLAQLDSGRDYDVATGMIDAIDDYLRDALSGDAIENMELWRNNDGV